MPDRRKYRNPPIEEALCEFRFVPSQEWDLTIPGRLHGKLKEQYPGKPRQQNIMETSVQLTGEGGKPAKVQMREGVARLQFVSEDGLRLVSVGSDVLSISGLKPYEGWEELRPRIETALTAYWEVSDPKAVSRIGVRYINKVVLPGTKSIELIDYFNCGPREPDEGFPTTMGGFLSRVEYRYEDGDTLLLTLASTPAPENSLAFLLDLDVFRRPADAPIPRAEVMQAVDTLRTRERDAFEASVTDKLREIFDAG